MRINKITRERIMESLSSLDDADLLAVSAEVRVEMDRRDGLTEEAAARAAAQLREQEVARLAREAVERARADQAAQAVRERQEAELREAASLRALAVRARELFGSDQEEFEVRVWSRGADKRVYIGGGYENNWVEYYATGNERIAPGALKVIGGVTRPLADHLGITQEDARKLVEDYCREVAAGWVTLRLEVTENNAPCDPAAVEERWVVRAATGYYWGGDRWVSGVSSAKKYSSRDQAADAGLGDAISVMVRVPFAPRVEVHS